MAGSRSYRLILVLAILLGTSQREWLSAQQQPPPTTIVGVWKIAEVIPPGGGKSNTSPQPAIIIFTRNYYSFNVVRTDAPRPELPVTGATDKQLADAFGPFDASAGRYEAAGNQLHYERVVAKNPNAMRPGTTSTGTIRFEGPNTVFLNEPRPTSATWKLSRLE